MCRQEPDSRVFFAIDFISYTFYPLHLYRRDVCLIMNLFQLSLSIHKTLVTAFTLRTVNLKYREFPQMLSLGREVCLFSFEGEMS